MTEQPQPDGLAKITWVDPLTQQRREYVLVEGATASIGRAPENDISIPERHVSRQHAVIVFRDGVFTITDLGSANGTFVNDRKLTGPFPLAHGDIIRLYVPILNFSAVVTEEEQEIARKTGTIIVPATGEGRPRLLATSGPQEGTEYTLFKDTVTIGRPTQEAAWDITIQDRAISRPHCRLTLRADGWRLSDLGSANGTLLNGNPVGTEAVALKDGDVIAVGETTLLFRLAPAQKPE
ncbi:MAG: FHA domain-containing protein [Anaerolineae bacterium]|nr:FHA domain-containing protein [Anaerolineae bacterium]